jgi:hypothetical protein
MEYLERDDAIHCAELPTTKERATLERIGRERRQARNRVPRMGKPRRSMA